MSDKKPWYRGGLRFACTQCGKCCTGAPGYVWIVEEEIAAMATSLNISPEEFRVLYVRKVGDRLSLKEDPITFDCVFLKAKQCQLYKERPKQCRTFPFWDENLRSLQDWKDTAERCEGIDREDAPLISLEEIEKQRNL